MSHQLDAPVVSNREVGRRTEHAMAEVNAGRRAHEDRLSDRQISGETASEFGAVELTGTGASKQALDGGAPRRTESMDAGLPAHTSDGAQPAQDAGESRERRLEPAERTLSSAALCGDPHEERARLQELAQEHLSGDRLTKFQEDVSAFERRACAQGIEPREVAATMRAVSRLMETQGNEVVSAADRLRLAEQVIH